MDILGDIGVHWNMGAVPSPLVAPQAISEKRVTQSTGFAVVEVDMVARQIGTGKATGKTPGIDRKSKIQPTYAHR